MYGRRSVRWGANLFSASFGMCGLAQCWSTAHSLHAAPAWPSHLLWLLAAAVYATTLAGYAWNTGATGRLRAELTDPTLGPFASLITIVPMLLGVALAEHSNVGRVVFLIALGLTVGLGGWLTGQWILADLGLAQLHPGYFLPTVAGGLIASAGSAALGYDALARAMFGYGVIGWLVLGPILIARLFVHPPLPRPLLPTMAIQVAPPVVAGNAWFEINGNRADMVGLMLAGYGILMVAVQLRIVPLYRRVPFGPGSWAFSFSYAAVFLLAIRWLAAQPVSGHLGWTYLLLFSITVAVAVLALTTALALYKGTYLPPTLPHPEPAGSW